MRNECSWRRSEEQMQVYEKSEDSYEAILRACFDPLTRNLQVIIRLDQKAASDNFEAAVSRS